MADNKINVGGRLHSIATGNVLGGANEIFDDDKNKRQSEINTETYSLVNDVNERLSGLSPDQQSALSVAAKATSNETKLGYYVCDTEGNVAAKVISNATGYVLSPGGSMKVKMTNANTVDNATLNINSTGAKALYYAGERASVNNTWDANELLEIYYDGTNYQAYNVAGGSGDGVFDVSKKYPTSGVEGGNTYTLDGALTVLNANLSVSKKKGGMSIKFIQNSDHKYVQYRLMADEWSTDTDDWAIVDGGVYIENPEFVRVVTDNEDKILYGVKSNGEFYFGAGCPQQVKDYVQTQIDVIIGVGDITEKIDTINEMIAFFDGIRHDETLQNLLQASAAAVAAEKSRAEAAEQALSTAKVDKEEGKGLIPTQYISETDNPEYTYVMADSEDKILFAIKVDGEIYFGVGCPEQVKKYVEEKIADLSLDEYEDIVTFLGDYLGGDATLKSIIDNLANIKVDKEEGKSLIDAEYADGVSQIENPEFAEVHTDADDKILYGIKQDGDFYFGAGVPSQIQEELDNKADLADFAEVAANKVDKEEGKSLIDAEVASSQSAIENPEYLKVELDAEDKVLSGTKADGSHYAYNMQSETIDAKVDKEEGKSLIDEEVSESLSAIEDPEERSEITTDSEEKIVSYRDSNGVLHENSGIMTPFIGEIKTDNIAQRSFILNRPREYDLPKYGNVKMEKELTYTDGSNNYKPSKITKVGSQYYVTSTLVDGQIVESSVEISIQENDIVLSQWPVNKDTKHYLKVSIDFNQYLSGVFYIEVKYQGHSTLNYPKKNFRFTFYKDILFSKKLKIKIGELIPASKFNLKAYWLDFTLIREHACYRIVQAIRETHSYEQQYPWNSSYPFNTQATGITNGFPINVEVSGEFRGIYWFCLAKDMNNFMLDDELMNGVCVQGDGGYSDTTFWQVLNPTEWSDLLADIDNNIGEDSLPYFQAFYNYLNSGNFNRETAHTHFDVKNWVDCFIILQMLGCTDLTNSNIILYAGEDKTIFSPMYYDMDWSFGINCPWNMSTFDNSQTSDQSLWRKIQSVFGEDIKQRYKELKGSIINMQFFTSMITSISRQIPYSDYEKELERWPNSSQYDSSWRRRGTISEILNWIEKRIIFMNGFFNV